MKKKLLLIVMVFLTAYAFGQNMMLEILPLKDGKVTYVGIVQADSINKEELYKRTKRWFIDTYKSGKDVIQLDDKENGDLIGKGFFETYWGQQTINIWQTIKVQVKDGRYRYEITDFNVKYYYAGEFVTGNRNIDMTLEAWDKSFSGRNNKRNEIYTDINSKVLSLIASLEKFVKSKPKDDW